MTVELTYVKKGDRFSFIPVSEESTPFQFEGSEAMGGGNGGIRPMDGLLYSAGACCGVYLVHILKKMRIELNTLSIQIEGERQLQVPYAFERLKFTLYIDEDAPLHKVETALQLTLTTYCSVTQTLNLPIDTCIQIE